MEKIEVSREDFKRFLGRLDPNPVRAWEVYAQLRLALLTYFEHNRCSDCQQLADETLDRIAKKPGDYAIVNVAEFAFGVARNVRREIARKAALQRDLSEAGEEKPEHRGPNAEDTIISGIDMAQRLACLRKCMAALPPEERQLFQQYHSDDSEALDEHRQRLAKALGVSWTTLRMRISRIRRKLENCFENCCAGSTPPSGRSDFENREQ
jgi:RNA polymerase sigma factor (sigma-70 family)